MIEHPVAKSLQCAAALFLLLALAAAAPALAQEDAENASASFSAGALVAPERFEAFFPETAAGHERVSLQTAAGPLPNGPMASPAADLRPLFMFLPEALMSVQGERPAQVSGGSAHYEGGGPRPVFVGVVDYGTLPEGLLAAYRASVAAGETRAVTFSMGASEAPGYEGTGVSDDAVPPHGVKALVGGRFEVVAFEQPPPGVSSVADFKALPSEDIEAMRNRARTVLRALDFGKLEALSEAPSAAQETDPDSARRLPPWEAWLQVQAGERGEGWHTGWMDINPMGARCYMVVFREDAQQEGADWLYLADVERLRFRPLADMDNAKDPVRLAEIAGLTAEEWQPVPLAAVRAQDGARGCEQWPDEDAED